MKKIIGEILVLIWKVLRLYLWKWVRVILAKVVVGAVLLVGIVALIVFLATRL